MARRVTLAGTMALCALALLFPPWGVYESFRTFAFVLSRDVHDPLVAFSSFSILWPTLAIEIVVILLAGGTCYLLIKGKQPDVGQARQNEHENPPSQYQPAERNPSASTTSEATKKNLEELQEVPYGEPNQPASHGARIGAALVDGLILGPSAALLSIGFLTIKNRYHWTLLLENNVLIHSVVIFVLYLAYHTLTQSSRHMASIGKRAFGLIVVRRDGGRIEHWRGLLRSAALYISALPTLPLVCALMNRRHLGLHDYLVGTAVLKKATYDPTRLHILCKGIQKAPPQSAASVHSIRISSDMKRLLTLILVVVVVGLGKAGFHLASAAVHHLSDKEHESVAAHATSKPPAFKAQFVSDEARIRSYIDREHKKTAEARRGHLETAKASPSLNFAALKNYSTRSRPLSPPANEQTLSKLRSINCTDSLTPYELAICDNPDLLEYDKSMSELYSTIKRTLSAEAFAGVQASQDTWIKQRDDLCGVSAKCLSREIQARTALLGEFIAEYETTDSSQPPDP